MKTSRCYGSAASPKVSCLKAQGCVTRHRGRQGGHKGSALMNRMIPFSLQRAVTLVGTEWQTWERVIVKLTSCVLFLLHMPACSSVSYQLTAFTRSWVDMVTHFWLASLQSYDLWTCLCLQIAQSQAFSYSNRKHTKTLGMVTRTPSKKEGEMSFSSSSQAHCFQNINK